jgi:hypothetical protein
LNNSSFAKYSSTSIVPILQVSLRASSKYIGLPAFVPSAFRFVRGASCD